MENERRGDTGFAMAFIIVVLGITVLYMLTPGPKVEGDVNRNITNQVAVSILGDATNIANPDAEVDGAVYCPHCGEPLQ